MTGLEYAIAGLLFMGVFFYAEPVQEPDGTNDGVGAPSEPPRNAPTRRS